MKVNTYVCRELWKNTLFILDFLFQKLNLTKKMFYNKMFSSLGSTELFSRADTTSGPGETSGTSCETAAVKNYTAFREERDTVQRQRR